MGILKIYPQSFSDNVYKLNQFDFSFNFTNDNVENQYLLYQKKVLELKKVDTLLIKKLNKNAQLKKDTILLYIAKGDSCIIKKNKHYNTAFNFFNLAYQKSINLKDSVLICETLKRINNYCLDTEKNIKSFKFYSNNYLKHAYNKFEQSQAMFFLLSFKLQQAYLEKKPFLIEKVTDDIKEQITICNRNKNIFLAADFHNLLGVSFDVNYKNLDEAIFHFKKAEEIYSTRKELSFFKHKIFDVLVNKSFVYNQKRNYIKSNEILFKALKIDIPNKQYKGFVNAYELISNNYFSLQNYKRAFNYLSKSKKLDAIIKRNKYAIATEEFQTKYQTEKKEKENLQLKQDNLVSEQKRKQNQNLFYGALSFLVLGGVITFLSLKNSRKKRLLAEQQQELEQQKNITLIKEQEIMAINAMIEGQEKERQIIAEDLHDNIGSVLATLKLHFENLKLNRKKKHFNQEELYEKTEKLIDETYLKVRSIAHAKNAGVIANQGLLVAVKLMAEKISSANKTQIEVLDYGLEKRIENTIELTAFRVIQELTTNIIKHANATKATINISLFDKVLNIIIEDNGKGFNFKETNLNNGMGLHAIQRKVKHLNGTFEVDSTLNKGTTIIINFPETNT
ncbi:hypothetical protein WH52_02650 [Tenacibaculum holothuriorum]|uniref:histidine kinase n=1 Tax=Tenacibaculum holothuriorum TaxID=1635173 RepID=A0A1Y2PIJ2_9FLAO|nr:hypothetical protein WH52_02650 [Tenacibaculum holothuriorum]